MDRDIVNASRQYFDSLRKKFRTQTTPEGREKANKKNTRGTRRGRRRRVCPGTSCSKNIELCDADV